MITRRDRIVDGVFVLTALGLGSVGLAASIQNGLRGPLIGIDAAVGVGLCAALWWRRRWPLGIAVAAVPVTALSSFAGAAGLVALFTLAAYRRWQQAAVLGALTLAIAPSGLLVHPSGGSITAQLVTGLVFTVVVVGAGVIVRARRDAQFERERHAEAEHQLRLEQVRYAERARIAREMHDVLAHRISLLSLHAGALEFHPDASPAEVAKASGVIRASAHQALEDLRAVIAVLRDGGEGDSTPPHPPQPTLAALPGLLEESRAAGMCLRADVRFPDLDAIPDAIGRQALRIIQEALTNVRKHAGAGPVDLLVDGTPGKGLTITVSNPAPIEAAATPIPGSGIGLVGMVERAVLSGGRLEHGLDDRGKFHLRAWLPWPA